MSLITKVLEKVSEIRDPQTGLTLGEMNLIKNISEIEEGVIRVDFKLTSPFCPIALPIALRIKEVALSIEGVKKAYVYLHEHSMEEAINKLVNR